jgi:hypothetical protein
VLITAIVFIAYQILHIISTALCIFVEEASDLVQPAKQMWLTFLDGYAACLLGGS